MRRLFPALARHPETPVWVLGEALEHESAARQTAEALCQNPAAPFFALSEPDAVFGWPREAQEALLLCPDAPPSLVALFARSDSPSIVGEVRGHIALAGEATEREWRAEVVREAQAIADAATGEGWEYLQELAHHGLLPPWVLLDTVPPGQRGAVPAEEQDDGDPVFDPTNALEETLRHLREIQDPTTSPDRLCILARGAIEHALLHAVMARPDVTPKALMAILRNRVWYTPCRLALARHPAADARLLRELVRRTGHPAVRQLVLRHPAAPADLPALCRRQVVPEARRLAVDERFFPTLRPVPWWDLPFTSHVMSSPWPERLATALGPDVRLRPLLLRALARDANRLVRAAARARLAGEYKPADVFSPGFGA